MNEVQGTDYICASCIEKADCCVEEYLSWYLTKYCLVCSKQVKTMQVKFITIKDEDK